MPPLVTKFSARRSRALCPRMQPKPLALVSSSVVTAAIACRFEQ